MAKGSVLSDSFEQLAELGVSTTKKSAQAVAKTFSPIKMLEQMIGAGTEAPSEKKDIPKGKNASTPLDFTKLKETYQNQDQVKVTALRNRLFQLVKSGEQSAQADKRMTEEQRKDREDKRPQKKKAPDESTEIPQGKQHRSIFSHKKMAERQHMENRPSSGKQ